MLFIPSYVQGLCVVQCAMLCYSNWYKITRYKMLKLKKKGNKLIKSYTLVHTLKTIVCKRCCIYTNIKFVFFMQFFSLDGQVGIWNYISHKIPAGVTKLNNSTDLVQTVIKIGSMERDFSKNTKQRFSIWISPHWRKIYGI